MGYFVMVSLWWASVTTNTRYRFLYFRTETNIPEEIRSTYSYLLCAAIQVWYGIIMLIPRFFDMSKSLNAIQYNYCLTTGVAFWRAFEISSVHTCMSFA